MEQLSTKLTKMTVSDLRTKLQIVQNQLQLLQRKNKVFTTKGIYTKSYSRLLEMSEGYSKELFNRL